MSKKYKKSTRQEQVANYLAYQLIGYFLEEHPQLSKWSFLKDVSKHKLGYTEGWHINEMLSIFFST